VLFYTASLIWLFHQSWNTIYAERCCIQILKCRVFLLLKMHKNVNINNKMHPFGVL
jgi:hypothetical protein